MNNQVFKEESVALKRSHSARPTTRAVDFTGAVKDNPASNDSIDDSDNNECEEIRASECFEEIDQVMKKLSELSEPLAIDYIIESNEDRLTPTNEISPEASEGIFKNSNDSLDCQEIVLSEPLAIDAVIESNEGRLTKPNETSHEVPEGIKISNDSLESEERVDDEAPHLQECITEIQLASLSSNQKLVAFSEDEAPKKNRTCLPKDDIGARLDRALDNSAKSVGTRLSSELIPLTKDYQAFRRKLPTMIKAAKKYLEVTSQREQHRTQVSKFLFLIVFNTVYSIPSYAAHFNFFFLAIPCICCFIEGFTVASSCGRSIGGSDDRESCQT